MVNDDRIEINIDRKKEMRSKDISKMISEGGLGSRTYYDVVKHSSSPEEAQKANQKTVSEKDEELKTASSIVNHLVANQGVLYVKLHQYHWYVKGPNFFTLHAKFEELYNETSKYFDIFAERLIAKGEKPFSTLGEYLEHTSISEKVYDGKISAENMVHYLIEDYHTIESFILEGINLAGEENDTVTEDMLIGYKEHIDQTIWMLEAYLDN